MINRNTASESGATVGLVRLADEETATACGGVSGLNDLRGLDPIRTAVRYWCGRGVGGTFQDFIYQLTN